MQKKLIAAAIAGLVAVPALAQTNVTISGRFAAGYESYKLSSCGNNGQSCSNESRVSDQSSRLIFNVVEDLGGGMKAWGQFDFRGALDNNTLANSGNSGIGLMGNWGKFTLGHWDVHYNEMVGLEANRAGSLQSIVSFGLMSQVNGTTIANGTRTSNLMMWDSPNWNGFTARLGYSTGWAANSSEGSGRRAIGATNPGKGSAWTGALRYNNGPWAAGLSYWNADVEGGNTAAAGDQTSTRAWVGYTFGMGLKLGFAYDRSKLDFVTGTADWSRGAWMIPVSYAFGPHKVYFNYARAGKTSNVANSKGSQWGLGYDYAFSKRTSAGVYYTKVNNSSGATYDMFGLTANGATATGGAGGAGGEDARQLYFGLAHNF